MGPLRVVAGDLPPCGTKSKASETTWSGGVRLRDHEREGKTTPARITTARQVPVAGPGARTARACSSMAVADGPQPSSNFLKSADCPRDLGRTVSSERAVQDGHIGERTGKHVITIPRRTIVYKKHMVLM